MKAITSNCKRGILAAEQNNEVIPDRTCEIIQVEKIKVGDQVEVEAERIKPVDLLSNNPDIRKRWSEFVARGSVRPIGEHRTDHSRDLVGKRWQSFVNEGLLDSGSEGLNIVQKKQQRNAKSRERKAKRKKFRQQKIAEKPSRKKKLRKRKSSQKLPVSQSVIEFVEEKKKSEISEAQAEPICNKVTQIENDLPSLKRPLDPQKNVCDETSPVQFCTSTNNQLYLRQICGNKIRKIGLGSS